MDNENREYHRIYPPIPKVRVFIKEEPEDSDDACDPPSGIQQGAVPDQTLEISSPENVLGSSDINLSADEEPSPNHNSAELISTGSSQYQGHLLAYYPLPRGPCKEEAGGDDGGELPFGIQGDAPDQTLGEILPLAENVASSEIISSDEDLVHSSAGSSSTGASMHQQESLRSYPPLPHGIVKVEAQSGDDHGARLGNGSDRLRESTVNNAVASTYDTQSSGNVTGRHPAENMSTRRILRSSHLSNRVTSPEHLDTSNSDSSTDEDPRPIHFSAGSSSTGRLRSGSGSDKSRATKRKSTVNNAVASSSHKPSSGNMAGRSSVPEGMSITSQRTLRSRSVSRVEKSTIKNLDPSDSDNSIDEDPRPGPSSANCSSKDGKSHVCPKCGKSYPLEKYLKRHLHDVCGVEPHLPCLRCGYKFKTKTNLQKHLVKIHNISKSQLAEFDASQLAEFDAGPKIRPVLPYKCMKCGRSYKQKASLTYHSKNQCGLGPKFQCTQCAQRYMRNRTLKIHMITVHNVATFGAAEPEVYPFKCDQCQKTFKTKRAIAHHLARVCGLELSVACTQCPFRTKTKQHLKRHLINIHDGTGLSELEA